jgi:ABC-type transport system involved in multi-copper enzyme maturation permease subunit
MYYFDVLRSLRGLKVYSIVLACTVVLELISLAYSHSSHGDMTIGVSGEALRAHTNDGYAMLHELGQHITIPFALLCSVAAVIAGIYAFSASSSLSRYNGNLHFVFTKPISRERAALTTFGIDALAILAAYAIAIAFVLIPLAAVGLLDRLSFDAHAPANVALGLGAGLMWYALLQAATAAVRGGSGLVIGLSWPFFVVLHALSNLTSEMVPAFIVSVIYAVNRVNPFTYLAPLFDRLGDFHGSVEPLAPTYAPSLATVWITALVCLAIAVVLRKRMEI